MSSADSDSEQQTAAPVAPRLVKRPVYRRRFFVPIVVLVLLLLVGGGFVVVAQGQPEVRAITIAVPTDVSGPAAPVRKDVLDSMQLYVNARNKAGGINGHPIKLTVYDDKSNVAEGAKVAQQIVNSDALAVVGHTLSTVSTAAGPIYKAGQIPAVTGTAFAESVTQNNPWYFRATVTNGEQGRLVANYLRQVLKVDHATLIYSNDTYGATFDAGFEKYWGELKGRLNRALVYDTASDKHDQSLQSVVAAVRADPDPGIIVLGTVDTDSVSLVVSLKRANPRLAFFGASSLGRNEYNDLFKAYPEENAVPGYFTEGLYSLTPFILDSSGEEGQSYNAAFAQTYNYSPDWFGVKAYDALTVLVKAIENSGITDVSESVQADRQKIRDALEAINSPDKAVKGISTLLYFDSDHNDLQLLRVGYFRQGKFISAPIQFHAVNNLGTVDVWKELQAGNLTLIDNTYVWLQKVAYTGIDPNLISKIDVGKSLFTVDFYLWFRYSGDIGAPQIEFPDAPDLVYKPDAPVLSQTINGLNYRLYRVRGDFRNEYDLHSYPFDKQTLQIRIRNSQLDSDRLVYAVDNFGLQLPRSYTRSAAPFQSLQSWHFTDSQYLVDNLSVASTRGDPRVFDTPNALEFSGLRFDMHLSRNYVVFVIKTLLPLVLITLVLYATLYFPMSLLKERITLAVTAILTSAVLLTAVNNQLTDIGYTVAIEYLFYIFFGLCLACIITALAVDRLKLAKREKASLRLDFAARMVYPLIIIGVVAFYWVNYISL